MKAIVCYGEKDLRLEERECEKPDKGEVVVNIEAGGICGSDLHYYNHGGFGTVRIKEPMILGHEVAGRIASVGEGVTNLKVGDVVAVSPSRPCGECEYCKKAQYNQCLNMRFYGSAMPMPHIQGAFRQQLVALQSQCHVFAKGTSASTAAFAEPLAVCLHAVRKAGNLMGKKVLVTGSGPIGVITAAVAKMHGALEVIITDVVDEPLKFALKTGADKALNTMTDAKAMEPYMEGKGQIDVIFEASGNQHALKTAFNAIRPGGRLIQLGQGGEVSIMQNQLVGKEIEWCGTFRFHEEFAWAVELLGSKRINLDPLVTHVFKLDEYVKAFETATDKKSSMKVQLSFV